MTLKLRCAFSISNSVHNDITGNLLSNVWSPGSNPGINSSAIIFYQAEIINVIIRN